MEELFSFTTKVDFTDYTLLIPSVSVGNVPQLTVDLIISTYNLKKVATIWHPAIVPSVGGDPFNKNNSDVCTACELYIKPEYKLAVVQLRSTIERKYANRFFEELTSKVVNLKFTRVIVLASSFAHEMHNVMSSKYRYYSTDISEDLFSSLNVEKMDLQSGNELVMHGAGFAGNLFGKLNSNVPTTILMKYCSEGDNRPDAIDMLGLLHKIMDNFENKTLGQVVFPTSWEHVFGNPPPIGIY